MRYLYQKNHLEDSEVARIGSEKPPNHYEAICNRQHCETHDKFLLSSGSQLQFSVTSWLSCTRMSLTNKCSLPSLYISEIRVCTVHVSCCRLEPCCSFCFLSRPKPGLKTCSCRCAVHQSVEMSLTSSTDAVSVIWPEIRHQIQIFRAMLAEAEKIKAGGGETK